MSTFLFPTYLLSPQRISGSVTLSASVITTVELKFIAYETEIRKNATKSCSVDKLFISLQP